MEGQAIILGISHFLAFVLGFFGGARLVVLIWRAIEQTLREEK